MVLFQTLYIDSNALFLQISSPVAIYYSLPVIFSSDRVSSKYFECCSADFFPPEIGESQRLHDSALFALALVHCCDLILPYLPVVLRQLVAKKWV